MLNSAQTNCVSDLTKPTQAVHSGHQNTNPFSADAKENVPSLNFDADTRASSSTFLIPSLQASTVSTGVSSGDSNPFSSSLLTEKSNQHNDQTIRQSSVSDSRQAATTANRRTQGESKPSTSSLLNPDEAHRGPLSDNRASDPFSQSSIAERVKSRQRNSKRRADTNFSGTAAAVC